MLMLQHVYRHLPAPGAMRCQQQWLHVQALGRSVSRRSRLRVYGSQIGPKRTPDLVDVQQNAASLNTDNNGWSEASPTSTKTAAEAPVTQNNTSNVISNGLSPAYVVAGAVAAITAAVAVVWLSGADSAQTALSTSAATSAATGVVPNAVSGALKTLPGPIAAVTAGIAPALSALLDSMWTHVLLPLGEIPQHMFLGWQHMWVVITSHPSLSPLSSSTPQWLVDATSAVSAAVAAVVIVAVAAGLSVKKHIHNEKEAIR